MLECVNKIIKHNSGEKSIKKPFVIYLDLECILTNYSKQLRKYSKQPRQILYRKKS